MMTASVSSARAMLILVGCLALGCLVGLLHSEAPENLRASTPQEQQTPTSGSGVMTPQIPDLDLFSRSAWPEHKEANPEGVADYVWDGHFAAAQQQALDMLDLSLSFSFSFEFEGSLSYDYYY